ncbi:PfkB family carbohydrate kinase [Agromyces soli]
MTDVLIFAPAPLLTVTLERDDAGDELHVHAGGQGVWQARMLRTLGRSVAMVASFAGETGEVARHLLVDEGVEVHAVMREGRGPAYIHDRRGGERAALAELPGDPLSRHDLDELYAAVLRESLEAGTVLLSGPADDATLPADLYRRLAADLRAAGRTVVVDLAGERLTAALEGGVRLVKVSESELRDEGRVRGDTVEALLESARAIRDAGAGSVVVTRADAPALVVDGDQAFTVSAPVLEEVDSRGAGDSFVAALVSAMLDGDALPEAARLAAAAGALNVTRHGLGTGDPEAIARLRDRVEVHPLEDAAGFVTLDQLAARAEVDGS